MLPLKRRRSEVGKCVKSGTRRSGQIALLLVQLLLLSFFALSTRNLTLPLSPRPPLPPSPLSYFPPMDDQSSPSSSTASAGFLFLVGSLGVGISGVSLLLGVRSALKGSGRGRTSSGEWNSRTPSLSRLPSLPPLVFLVPIFLFYPLSGLFYVVSVGRTSVTLHNLSVVFDGLGRGGLWLSLHLLLPFVAPYPPIGLEWWFRRGVDGLLLLLFTGSTSTLLASPFVPSLEGAGLVVSHGLALALNSVVFLVLTFNNSSIPRLLVLGQLAAQASDIQGMVGASAAAGAGFDVGRAGCVVIWMGLAGAWYTSSIISSHLLGDLAPPVHDRRSRHSPYGGGYGQVTSGSSMGQFFGHVTNGRPSSIELSPASFASPELATPNPTHDVGFRPFKMPVSDYDEVGVAVSGTSPYHEAVRFPPSRESAGLTESLVDTVPQSRESQPRLSGVGFGSLRRGSSKSTTNLRGSPSGNALDRSTGSVDLLAERPSSSRSLRDRTSSTLPSLFKRSASPSPSLALTLPSPDPDAFEFDPFSRQQDQGAIKIQRHNSGYEPPSVTTPRPSPREINFPAEINSERRPSQTSLVTPELSFTVRAPSRAEARSAVSSFNAEKLNSYTFPQVPSTPTASSTLTVNEEAEEAAVVAEEPQNINHSRWSTSASDLTLTKRDEWITRDSYVRASLTPSEMGSTVTPRKLSNETPTSGIWSVVDNDVEEKMVDARTAERSPFSRMGSLLAAQSRVDGLNIPPPPVDIGRALTQLSKITEESSSPSPKSEKKRPSRLDLSPSSIFRRASGGTATGSGSASNSNSPSPGSAFPPGSALDDLPSPSSYLTPGAQSRQNLLRPSNSPKLNTSLISRPTPQSNRYPIGHILTHEAKSPSVSSSSNGSSSIAGGSGQLVSPTKFAYRFGSPPSTLDGESPGPRTPTIFGRGAPPGGLTSPRPAARAAGRARAGTTASMLGVPKGRGSMVSLSTVGSMYDGVPMVVTKREEGGRKGSVPNLTSTWL